MARPLTPQEVRNLAENLRVAEDPACHLRDHGLTLAEVVVSLRHCFRVQADPRSHKGKPPSGSAFRADCHQVRGITMRVDFNLVQSPTGEIILVVTAFVRGDLA